MNVICKQCKAQVRHDLWISGQHDCPLSLDPMMEDVIDCEECGQELDPKKAVMLKLRTSTGTYHRAEPSQDWFGTDDDQGGFWFGSACARKVAH